ncbi:hypothetical conserved protein [Candidatus Nitrosoglobus terrae]|uniref:Hypothetical conserved protein n=1 Tax=Candidatus Nitrosoglobus terrae TaxID=1630141 RepID=A0A1Q2SNA5_9GAMM|nr:hypothetical protein [Candidatus Nitrosoglobus terrae]BAW80635.1 hypothetical conserved protein [Candidatus Nitrosoglobus terrae]
MISDEVSPLRVISKTIDAADFNRVRLALRRLGSPLRVALPEHRGLEVILDNQVWLCVDSCHEDRLILAWRSFAMVERQGLHEPVKCELCFYHMHAGLIMGSAVEQLSQALEQRLTEDRNSI